MKSYKIVFSPTGGTQKVANIIASAFGSESEEVDLSKADFSACSLEGEGIAIIAVPSFGGRAPKIAMDRLKMIQGNGIKAIVIAVYGNRAQEDTLIEVADAAKECGFKVIAGIEAIAEHSIAHQYAANRPNKEDEKQLTEFAKQVLEKTALSSDTAPHIPGNRPYKKAGAGLVPKASAACVKCGACVYKCPVGAIDKNNPRLTNKTTCINCMRCVSVCPQNARTVNAMMVKIVGVALKKDCSVQKENKLYL